MDSPVEVTAREFARIVAELELNTKAVNDLIHLIRGNGSPGLLVRVDRLERATDSSIPESIGERVSLCEKEIYQIRDTMKTTARVIWGFAAMFIVFFAGLMWAVITHQITITVP